MNLMTRGLLSAALAGLLLALLLWIQGALGVLPALDLIGLLARVLGEERDAAWLLYGAVTMLGFGLALPVLADEEGRGMAPALGLAGTGWFATMMGLLPMAGFAPFGLGLSWAVPVLTLAQAAAFGLALGWLFEHLPRRGAAEAQMPQPVVAVAVAAEPAPLPAPVVTRTTPRAADALRTARAGLVSALQRLLAAHGTGQSLPSGRA